VWDSILDVVKGLPRGRTMQPLIATHAQVLEVRGGVLVLGFTTGPLERLFKTGGGEDLLREGLTKILGVDWRIETTLSGPAATAVASGGDVESAAPLPTPSQSMAADRAPSRSAAARAAANEPKEPRVRRTAEPEPTAIVLDDPNPDDDDADDGTSGLALLQRHLGATVIDDGETS
jgi:DNA polymerase-3 subunit gamma/tau